MIFLFHCLVPVQNSPQTGPDKYHSCCLKNPVEVPIFREKNHIAIFHDLAYKVMFPLLSR